MKNKFYVFVIIHALIIVWKCLITVNIPQLSLPSEINRWINWKKLISNFSFDTINREDVETFLLSTPFLILIKMLLDILTYWECKAFFSFNYVIPNSQSSTSIVLNYFLEFWRTDILFLILESHNTFINYKSG